MFKPNFDKGLILKQHMLEALRDYPNTFVQLLFWEMGDGILSGLKISLDGECFRVSEGLVKLGGEVCFMTEAVCLEQKGGLHYVYLQRLPPVPARDGSGSTCQLRVIQCDGEQESASDWMELFRYGKNAEMKEYQNIREIYQDMSNRIDRSHALKSVAGGSTLCDEYYGMFAAFLLQSQQTDARDISFAYQCLNGVHTLAAIQAYFRTEDTSNRSLIQCMKRREQELSHQFQPQLDTSPEHGLEKQTITVS